MRILRVLILLIIVLSILLTSCVLLFRSKYYSVISSLAQTQVKNATSDLINDAIDRQIEDGTIQYDRMV